MYFMILIVLKMVVSDATHIDPKDYFDPKSPRPNRSLIGQYWYMGSMTAVFAFAPAIQNYALRRPFFSGIQKHIAMAIVGMGFGYWVDKMTRKRSAERDYFYYQYMCDHPEDFPLIERKKFRDVMEPWHPIR
ncbi:NADH:ubiquinone oxidoreductase subunit b14.5b [Trinorchestia longiramus]|nr:NADH:ubiquinone oxidoreductase subunit b14.5b [Trinorchestia longiramus]